MVRNDYEAPEPTTSDLAELALLAKRLHEAEVELAKQEEIAKKAKAIVTDLAEHAIPEKMREVGMKKFTTTSGFEITVKETVRASIPVAKRGEAMTWLDENGHGGLIKRTIHVAFDRDQEKRAAKLREELEKEYENVKTERKVEPSTLRAFIGEQLRSEGAEKFPMALFGAWQQRVAKVKPADEKPAGRPIHLRTKKRQL